MVKKKAGNRIIVGIVVAIVLIVGIVLLIITSNSDIKLDYEIDIGKVPPNYSYSQIDNEVGIQCGSVKIVLGQRIDISPYTIEEEIDIDNVTVRKLLAPSKKYELVVVGFERIWYVYEIRTTFPEVYSLSGYTIGDTKKDVKKIVKIPNKNKITYKNTEHTEINMQFISGYLVVLDMRCV